jgi:hypothetical protein
MKKFIRAWQQRQFLMQKKRGISVLTEKKCQVYGIKEF